MIEKGLGGLAKRSIECDPDVCNRWVHADQTSSLFKPETITLWISHFVRLKSTNLEQNKNGM
jgi:hypothetical protein